ncbi:MAG: tRNA (adenosine(37)-N6)-threonylcarbamoyltransferase complex transferase subunit TsaD [Calditrichia bacterium]|nr:tRNA (adenosine(37)-N6)-threonylcarbamoyltransferase complex transferase subunit TsaD [Calditrichota bacterium]MCB9068791.1 tRNA (adenosine(37)-N6)-threonylcarbamoyltransferase complex transferase subunit TsaD [Calditrichia bacterium]
MKILGIETSCDETSASVIEENQVLSNVISSQMVHLQFGGVVPELASRAHLRKIIPVVESALEQANCTFADIDAIAVTHGPGLIGALMVGVNYVKGLATVFNKPFIGVNHIEGHIYSNFLENDELQLPLLCLTVSGGHSQIVVMKNHLEYHLIGSTRDDAVGEAFDKVAKLLGLPYPGGPQIDKLAKSGNPEAIRFPIGLSKEKTFDFSYSGLKTAVLNHVQSISEAKKDETLADICASFQHAAVKQLTDRTIAAARAYSISQIAVAGGVAANSGLREMMKLSAQKYGMQVYFPAMKYCTDNAAMIARAGLERLRREERSGLMLNAFAALKLGDKKHLG